jgi:hypothetical protein
MFCNNILCLIKLIEESEKEKNDNWNRIKENNWFWRF